MNCRFEIRRNVLAAMTEPVSNSTLDPLIQAYLNTHYHVDEFEHPIRISRHSDELHRVLENQNADKWAYITAFNPCSNLLPDAENSDRHEELRARLSDFHVMEGEGRDPNGAWPAERSFLVIGISLEHAVDLAQEFGQRAIVFGEKGEVARLVETSVEC